MNELCTRTAAFAFATLRKRADDLHELCFADVVLVFELSRLWTYFADVLFSSLNICFCRLFSSLNDICFDNVLFSSDVLVLVFEHMLYRRPVLVFEHSLQTSCSRLWTYALQTSFSAYALRPVLVFEHADVRSRLNICFADTFSCLNCFDNILFSSFEHTLLQTSALQSPVLVFEYMLCRLQFASRFLRRSPGMLEFRWYQVFAEIAGSKEHKEKYSVFLGKNSMCELQMLIWQGKSRDERMSPVVWFPQWNTNFRLVCSDFDGIKYSQR